MLHIEVSEKHLFLQLQRDMCPMWIELPDVNHHVLESHQSFCEYCSRNLMISIVNSFTSHVNIP
jgi:hypothetical protein